MKQIDKNLQKIKRDCDLLSLVLVGHKDAVISKIVGISTKRVNILRRHYITKAEYLFKDYEEKINNN